MKRITFILVIALSATAMWAQSGVILSYTEGGVQKEQAFRLDSVSSWGYNPSDKTVFVQPLVGVKFSIPSQNFLSFIYSPIVPDNAGVSDYLVVHVDGQTAAFSLEDDGFEMTWKNGVLAIKDKNQSQTIGLKNGISFTIENLSFGYTNPNIPSTPAIGNWYLVVYKDQSYDSNHFCGSVHYTNGQLYLRIFRIGTTKPSHSFYFSSDFLHYEDFSGMLYISNKIVGDLLEVGQ